MFEYLRPENLLQRFVWASVLFNVIGAVVSVFMPEASFTFGGIGVGFWLAAAWMWVDEQL